MKIYYLIFVFFLPTLVLAKSPEIYVVDIQKVLEDSIAGKAARNDLEAELKKRQARAEVERTKLVDLQKTTEKQVALLSPDAAEQKVENLKKKQREFARMIQDEKEEIAALKERKLGKIVDLIDGVIDEIADEQEYPIVLEKDPRVILYSSEQYDITEKVLSRLNKRNFDL